MKTILASSLKQNFCSYISDLYKRFLPILNFVMVVRWRSKQMAECLANTEPVTSDNRHSVRLAYFAVALSSQQSIPQTPQICILSSSSQLFIQKNILNRLQFTYFLLPRGYLCSVQLLFNRFLHRNFPYILRYSYQLQCVNFDVCHFAFTVKCYLFVRVRVVYTVFTIKR